MSGAVSASAARFIWRCCRRSSDTSTNTLAECGSRRIRAGGREGPPIWFSSQSTGFRSMRPRSPGLAPSPKRFAAIMVSFFKSLIPFQEKRASYQLVYPEPALYDRPPAILAQAAMIMSTKTKN
jgi:hypothetical protein